MPDTWKAEVNVGSVSAGGLNSEYKLTASDFGSSLFPIIVILIGDDGMGGFETHQIMGIQVGGSEVPAIADLVSAGSGPFATGGVLSIEKDEGAGTITFSGPLGSGVWTPVSMPAGELAPLALSVHFTPPVAGAQTRTITFHDFYGRKNGTLIRGAPLSSTDRGAWLSTADPLTPWDQESPSPHVSYTSGDTGSEIGINVLFDSGATPFNAQGGAGREWDLSVYLSAQTGTLLDMARSKEHGILWADYVLGATPSVVNWRRSYNKGIDWETGTVYSTGGTNNNSLSLAWDGRRLIGVWYTGAAILQSVSLDLGTTWETPVTLSITGTNPRHLIDDAHGTSFYFYISSNDLYVRRSSTLGNDFWDGGVLVASGIGAQTVAAQIAADHSIVVGYLVSGAWTQKRSRDQGTSWN